VGLQEGGLGQHQNKKSEKWNACFKELFNYRSEHGDCNVPLRQEKLGTWVQIQQIQQTLFVAGLAA